jgi:hypothetical protein
MPEPPRKIEAGSRGISQSSKALTPSVAKIAVAPNLEAARTCLTIQEVDLFQN